MSERSRRQTLNFRVMARHQDLRDALVLKDLGARVVRIIQQDH